MSPPWSSATWRSRPGGLSARPATAGGRHDHFDRAPGSSRRRKRPGPADADRGVGLSRPVQRSTQAGDAREDLVGGGRWPPLRAHSWKALVPSRRTARMGAGATHRPAPEPARAEARSTRLELKRWPTGAPSSTRKPRAAVSFPGGKWRCPRGSAERRRGASRSAVTSRLHMPSPPAASAIARLKSRRGASRGATASGGRAREARRPLAARRGARPHVTAWRRRGPVWTSRWPKAPTTARRRRRRWSPAWSGLAPRPGGERLGDAVRSTRRRSLSRCCSTSDACERRDGRTVDASSGGKSGRASRALRVFRTRAFGAPRRGTPVAKGSGRRRESRGATAADQAQGFHPSAARWGQPAICRHEGVARPEIRGCPWSRAAVGALSSSTCTRRNPDRRAGYLGRPLRGAPRTGRRLRGLRSRWAR